jgi:DNA-binding FrmR family transcriptional regulator
MAAEHQHTETEQVIHRLSRAIGHLESVKRMVEEGRDCSEILVQIAAVRSAVNNIGKLILRDHMEHCVAAALQKGDTGALAQLNTALDQFIK